MRYLSFCIRNYRAITAPLTIDVERRSLTPIIGVNECGKTTILQAIFAFDGINDSLNGGKHLEDVANLYSTKRAHATVGATVELTWHEFREALKAIDDASVQSSIGTYKTRKKVFTDSITITRDLSTRKYLIDDERFKNAALNHLVAEEIIRHLPYILYFDDFRDSVDDRIEIPTDADTPAVGWLAIMEELFRQTDGTLAVRDLPDAEPRHRKSMIARVEKKLNATLTRDWQDFRLDDSDALKISLEYVEDSGRRFLQLDIVESDAQGNEHYFYVRDRSKGFYWFFNFVMKLEFNPKSIGTPGQDSVYLLDEPGSYLHAAAQMKLCQKLRDLAAKNTVLYCTHSHYLLNPEVIPLNFVHVATKDAAGRISLCSVHEHRGSIAERSSAFQPLLDALEVKPVFLDIGSEVVVITEGIYDYYCLEMLKGGRGLRIVPACGAPSMRHLISLMIAWHAKYFALWDNDGAGRDSRAQAEKHFGLEEANTHFRFLPPHGKGKKRILQDLFRGSDMRMIRSKLGIPTNTGFEKTIVSLFYSPQRAQVLGDMSPETHKAFAEVFALFDEDGTIPTTT